MRDDENQEPQATVTTAEDEALVEQGSVSDGTQSGPLGRALDNGLGFRV